MIVNALHYSAYRFAALFHSKTALWELLEHTGIAVFAGPNGSGKSLAMVHAALPLLDGVEWHCEVTSHRHHDSYRAHVESGDCSAHCDLREANAGQRCAYGQGLVVSHSTGLRRIYSTVPILDDNGGEHPLYVPLSDYAQLMSIEHADVFFDEVAGVSDAQDSGKMPQQVVNYMHKLRKADVRLRCTTPDYDRCSLPIRQACQIVVDCTASFSVKGTSGRIWRPRKMMRYQAFDARQFQHLTPEKREKLKAKAKAVFWRPGCEAERRYDTLGAVGMLAHVNDYGVCMACDGTRRRPVCKCHESKPATDAVAIAQGPTDRPALGVVS